MPVPQVSIPWAEAVAAIPDTVKIAVTTAGNGASEYGPRAMDAAKAAVTGEGPKVAGNVGLFQKQPYCNGPSTKLCLTIYVTTR